MNTPRIAMTAAIALCIASPCLAQAAASPVPPAMLPYGPDITTEQAQVAITAAEAELRRNHWIQAIAVVEPSGDLVMFKKMTGTSYGSANVSIDKAKSAAIYKASGKQHYDMLQSGMTLLLKVPDLFPAEGGVPIVVGGRIIGAIGVSGATAEQDGQVAAAGAAAVQAMP